MNDWNLLLEIDVAEPRVAKDLLAWSAYGDVWDTLKTSDVFLDPVTKTAMLYPLAATPEWDTSFGGAYARLRKTDYALVDSNWAENPRSNAGDWYLESRDNTGELVTTTTVYPANQPFYLAAYVHQKKSDNAPFLYCGWGNPATGVSLRFSGNGDTTVFKGGVQVGFYDAGGGEVFAKRRKSGGGAIGDEDLKLLLIPCRGTELLVLTSNGVGFNHVFADLALTGDMATVTPPGAFWWQVPAPLKASVSAAPLRFKTAGVVRSSSLGVRYPPEFGAFFDTRLGFHVPAYATATGGTVTLVDAASDAAFFANGVNADPVRVKVSMFGDGSATPFVYSADFIKSRTLTATANAPFDCTKFVRSLTLTVPETGAATVSFTAAPSQLTAAGLDRPTRISDRPVRLALKKGAVVRDIFRGTAAKPTVTYALTDAARVGAWECTDREAQFALYGFRDTLPYDGFSLSNTIISLVGTAGFALSETDVSTDTFTLAGTAPNASTGNFNYLPERGDTVATWIDRLHSDLAATWITGWTPTPTGYKYRFRRPDTYSTTPVMTLYMTSDAARAAGVPPERIAYRVVRALRRSGADAEANQISVIGQNPQTGAYITASYDDADSQNPTLAPADRPENWRGQLVGYGLTDPQITTQGTANRARDIVTERLTTGKVFFEIDADFLIRADAGFEGLPVWKGDILQVAEPEAGVASMNVEVLSFKMQSEFEGGKAGKVNHRSATYQCEQVSEVLA